MSTQVEREAEDSYEAENDPAPVEGEVVDDSYTRDTNPYISSQMPIQRDGEDYDDPMQPPYSNSEQQLADDEREAIDKKNILSGDRLRHAKPRTKNQYNEGPAEDDLPSDIRYGLSGVSGTKRVT